jgi:hypothetical protein
MIRNGRKAALSGQLLKAAEAGGKKQGPIAGKLAVKSGQLLEAASLGGIMTCHLRWHVARGRVSPKCSLC